MKGSWKIATAAGIGIYLHFTFPILFLWIGISQYLRHNRWQEALASVVLVAILFIIVVLHELGHALTAKRFGIRTRDITLLPIGGIARLDRIPDDPRQELLVALAGPAVNVVLAALFLVAALLGPLIIGTAGLASLIHRVDMSLMWMNVTLAVFNLLPAFPMDGGRVLRALLAMRTSHERATRIAAGIGQGLAWGLGLVGLFTNPLLVFIAAFVWIGAAHEADLVQTTAVLVDLPIRKVMVKEFGTLVPEDTLARAAEHVLSGYQHDFPVLEEGHLVGVLTRADLLRGLAAFGQSSLVGDVMQKNFCTASATEMAAPALGRLAEEDCRSMPVLEDGKLIGILNPENVGEYLMIQAAVSEASRNKTLRKHSAATTAAIGP